MAPGHQQPPAEPGGLRDKARTTSVLRDGGALVAPACLLDPRRQRLRPSNLGSQAEAYQ